MNELCRPSATGAVALLKRRTMSPLELIDAAAARIEATDSRLNALPAGIVPGSDKQCLT